MRNETISADITVIGGGLAGICAAIAAARLGQTVSLINNRPVLGGNSSSEVRVWVCGATGHGIQRYARETGIMGELFIENQYRNIEGNPYYWDMVVHEAVAAEPNIQLFLNTDVHEVEATGNDEERTIHSVTGWMMGSERRIRFISKQFLDCTGDGLVGFLAGAKYRLGREAKEEYNEEWAPLAADDITLGSTLLFYTKDAGRTVKYIPPSFAKDIATTTIPERRIIRSGDNGCAYWWIEWGGEHDTVHDNEKIRDELWAVIYGIWDYIKNSGKFNADSLTLEWVGSIPGKREYRRFVGDYVLNQNDILTQTAFEDRVAFGGWSIDLHPPQGMYAEASGSKHLFSDGVYHIPYRSLYSINVTNMLMAGRDISASHVAFGTTRVMATCAVIGEAAGTAAALCAQLDTTPRTLHADHLQELQQTLLKQDASVIGLRNEDDFDLARQAHIRASSTLERFAMEQTSGAVLLDHAIGFILPVDPSVEGIELLIDAKATAALTLELWDTSRAENYVPHTLQTSAAATAKQGGLQWIKFDLVWEPDAACNAFLVLHANEAAALHFSDRPQSGCIAFRKDAADRISQLEAVQPDQPVVEWNMRAFLRQTPCFRLTTPTAAFAPDKVIDGYIRPYGGPHLWSSEMIQAGQQEWLELSWKQPIVISQIHITFNDDVNEDLINLHHHRTAFEAIPNLAKDYRIEELDSEGEWHVITSVTNNHKRKHVHHYDSTSTSSTDRIRVVIKCTNGAPYAEIIEIRVYA